MSYCDAPGDGGLEKSNVKQPSALRLNAMRFARLRPGLFGGVVGVECCAVVAWSASKPEGGTGRVLVDLELGATAVGGLCEVCDPGAAGGQHVVEFAFGLALPRAATRGSEHGRPCILHSLHFSGHGLSNSHCTACEYPTTTGDIRQTFCFRSRQPSHFSKVSFLRSCSFGSFEQSCPKLWHRRQGARSDSCIAIVHLASVSVIGSLSLE